MKVLNIHQAKTHLSAVLADVESRQETYRICRHGRPVADLVPHRRIDRLAPHPVMSRIEIRYDPCEPLTADEWPEEDE